VRNFTSVEKDTLNARKATLSSRKCKIKAKTSFKGHAQLKEGHSQYSKFLQHTDFIIVEETYANTRVSCESDIRLDHDSLKFYSRLRLTFKSFLLHKGSPFKAITNSLIRRIRVNWLMLCQYCGYIKQPQTYRRRSCGSIPCDSIEDKQLPCILASITRIGAEAPYDSIGKPILHAKTHYTYRK